MCGICGIVDYNSNIIDKNQLRQMMKNIKHRGPDDEGSFINQNIGLGHVRLSIIDLSAAGHQPMFSPDKRYCLIYNGEVYNYLELRKQLEKKYSFTSNTDTEVVLYSYIEWGEKCLRRFNGMFAFAILDTFDNSLFIARDRFGIKPFYYINNNQHLIFASEQRALLPFLNNKIPNNRAIYEYLIYNRTDQGEYTFFKDIKKLPAGALAIIKNNDLKILKWYKLEEELKEPFSHPEEFYNSLKQSISLRLRSDVPVGVCLSGGLDSSSIVSVLINDFNKTDLNTFSAVYEKGDKADESEFINEYKSSLTNMNFIFPTAETLLTDLDNFIECHSEPVATLGPYAQFKVFQLAQKHVKVTLDGQGADEELAGYHYFFGSYYKELLGKLKLFRLLNEMNIYVQKYHSLLAFKYLGLYLLPTFLKDYFSKISHDYITKEFYQKEKISSNIKSNLYNPNTLNQSLLQHFQYKLEHLLKWEDHNSMWHSLESRVPFLDHNLVERTLSLPSFNLINRGTTKYFLRQAMINSLPERIRLRQDKIGFATPWDKWFKENKISKIINDILNSKEFSDRGYLNSSKCLNSYKFHLENKINISKEIWKWINLELWFRKFID